MNTPAESIGPTAGLYDIVHIFLTRAYRKLPVVDDAGRVIGQGQSLRYARGVRIVSRRPAPLRRQGRAATRGLRRRFRDASRPRPKVAGRSRLRRLEACRQADKRHVTSCQCRAPSPHLDVHSGVGAGRLRQAGRQANGTPRASTHLLCGHGSPREVLDNRVVTLSGWGRVIGHRFMINLDGVDTLSFGQPSGLAR